MGSPGSDASPVASEGSGHGRNRAPHGVCSDPVAEAERPLPLVVTATTGRMSRPRCPSRLSRVLGACDGCALPFQNLPQASPAPPHRDSVALRCL